MLEAVTLVEHVRSAPFRHILVSSNRRYKSVVASQRTTMLSSTLYPVTTLQSNYVADVGHVGYRGSGNIVVSMVHISLNCINEAMVCSFWHTFYPIIHTFTSAFQS